MNIDKEIREFLQSERKMFEEGRSKRSPYLEEKRSRKGKVEIESAEAEQNQLRKNWKKGRKEIKIACHNVNGLKTKGWKLGNLLDWAEEEEIAILGVTETNLTEREAKFLTYNTSKKYIGYWVNAVEDKKKGSGLGILVEEH